MTLLPLVVVNKNPSDSTLLILHLLSLIIYFFVFEKDKQYQQNTWCMQNGEKGATERKRAKDVTKGHRMSDKTLLDLFVFLSSSDESHLLWLTAMEVDIKEDHSRDKCLFLYNEQAAGLVEKRNQEVDKICKNV